MYTWCVKYVYVYVYVCIRYLSVCAYACICVSSICVCACICRASIVCVNVCMHVSGIFVYVYESMRIHVHQVPICVCV